jgi:hypothetical protein
MQRVLLHFKILGTCTVATLAIKYNGLSHMEILQVNNALTSSGNHRGHKPSCISSHACVTEHLFILAATGKMSRNCTVRIPQLVTLSALRSSCLCGYDHKFTEMFGLGFRSTARALYLLCITKNQPV